MLSGVTLAILKWFVPTKMTKNQTVCGCWVCMLVTWVHVHLPENPISFFVSVWVKLNEGANFLTSATVNKMSLPLPKPFFVTCLFSFTYYSCESASISLQGVSLNKCFFLCKYWTFFFLWNTSKETECQSFTLSNLIGHISLFFLFSKPSVEVDRGSMRTEKGMTCSSFN